MPLLHRTLRSRVRPLDPARVVGVSATATSNPVSGAAICFVTFEVPDAGGLLVDVNDLTSAPSSVQVSAVAAAPQMRDGGFAILAG